MPFNKFGSAWREKAFTTDPDEKLHTADPSHAQSSNDPNTTWIAPADVHDQPDYLYDEDAVVGDYVSDATGLVLDTTPTDHNDGGDFGISTTFVDQGATNAASAGRSYGAERADTFQVPPFQDASTRYLSPRFEGLDGTAVAPVALLRGLNSDPANNPDGFRRGWVDQTFVDRRMYDPERTHDRRFLTPNVAFMESNQAPVPTTSGTPFDSLARSLRTISQRPQIRREPPSMSDSLMYDGSDEGYAYDTQPGDWVAG
jgi:hypothetical protein